MFLEELRKMKRQKKLTSIYSEVDITNKFSVGYVVGVNEKHLILASVTPTGEYDGFLLKELDSIIKISTGGVYIDKLLKLIRINKTEFGGSFEGDDLLLQLLVFAQKNHEIVSIELIDSDCADCIGFIESVEDGVCTIQEVNEFGQSNVEHQW